MLGWKKKSSWNSLFTHNWKTVVNEYVVTRKIVIISLVSAISRILKYVMFWWKHFINHFICSVPKHHFHHFFHSKFINDPANTLAFLDIVLKCDTVQKSFKVFAFAFSALRHINLLGHSWISLNLNLISNI